MASGPSATAAAPACLAAPTLALAVGSASRAGLRYVGEGRGLPPLRVRPCTPAPARVRRPPQLLEAAQRCPLLQACLRHLRAREPVPVAVALGTASRRTGLRGGTAAA
eukprot:10307983-Alexandrium_andersonii.AAC.1